MLNIPHKLEEELTKSNNPNVLLIGSGGGYDVVSCLPMYYTLRYKGFHPHIANYSRSDFSSIPLEETRNINSNIRGALPPQVHRPANHYPEGLMAKWFSLQSSLGEVVIWMLKGRQSSKELSTSLGILCKKLNISHIILCGYGMRSIMMGDEEKSGLMIWPSIILAATKSLDIKTKIMTMGLNTNPHPNTEAYNTALENTSKLIRIGAYYGGCNLEKSMDSFEYYKDGYTFISDSEGHDQDPMHESIITAIMGGYGQHKDGGWIYANMSQCNFFDAQPVIDRNLIIPTIESVSDFQEMFQLGMQTLGSHTIIRNAMPIIM